MLVNRLKVCLALVLIIFNDFVALSVEPINFKTVIENFLGVGLVRFEDRFKEVPWCFKLVSSC